MGQLIVRNLDNDVIDRLKDLAAREGRSLEGEVRGILQQAAEEPRLDMAAARALCDRIRRSIKLPPGTDSTALIREDRDR